MRTITTLIGCLMLSFYGLQAQVYSDHFDDGMTTPMGGAGSYTFSEANSELTVTATNTGAWDVFTYQLTDENGNPVSIDVSGNNKLYVRAKASVVPTQFRVDLQDTAGYTTTVPGLIKTLTTDFLVLEFDFAGAYVDGGYGGTPCAMGPCGVDSSQIASLLFYTNPGAGGFNGTVVMDYLSFGQAPDTVITSGVFQDHMDDSSSVQSVAFLGQGYSASQAGSALMITGDGTTGQYDPFTYIFANHANQDTFDIDITGNYQLFIKVKSTAPNTALRIDVQDINGFASTQGSLTNIVDTVYQVLKYDFSGVMNDLGYGGTPCTQSTAPCPVDGTRVQQLLFFIEPGTGAFPGTISIDYISFGISLEPLGPEPDLIYQDHFGDETLSYTSGTAGFTVAEEGSDLVLTGDGTGPPYAAISYLFHDQDSLNQIFLNMGPGGNKVYLRAKVDSGMVPIRMDLLDTAGYTTSQTELTKSFGEDWQVLEYDFTGGYFDGGFGGTPCASGPCPVDPTAISQVLIYPDPVQGGFNGEIRIDYISVGQPAGEDLGPKGVVNYADLMDDNTSLFITDVGGFTSAVANDEWTITGDGTSGQYAALLYNMHNDAGELILANAVGSNSKLYVRAKASVDATVLRIDVQDKLGYVSNLNAVSTTLGTDYAIYELDYSNAYTDGAYGGTPCMTSGCPVDGERIENLQFFVNPDVGGYSGTVTIDWISFGDNTVGINDLEKLASLKAYPNPTRSLLNVDYELPEAGEVRLLLTNNMGQHIQMTQAGFQFAGAHQHTFDLQSMPSGIYMVQIMVENKVAGSLKILKQ
ncbi:MAG: T9SS type A sorting domain-containing protein [Bacteroidota bacterium]